MAKQKIFEKFIKKDYNNDLEEVLSKKEFQEEVKNLLLDIMYKVEMSYKDYETVKKNVLPKEKYIENIIKSVKQNCESINFWKTTDVKTSAYSVNKQRKQILCFPISSKLLYCLAKIQKFDDIIKQEPEILNTTLTNLLNTGNNINMVEPLRDFNGYSWNISALDIENYYYNLIYQDLIILIGNNILEEWTNKNDDMVDYMELFKGEIESKYGKTLLKQLLEELKILSILLEIETNKPFKKEMAERKQIVQDELLKMENKQQYIDDLSKEKKKISKEIKEMDIIINDKEKLKEEYKKRNQDLPLEKKIFSIRVLTKKIKEEREEKILKLKQINEKLNSNNFLKIQNELKYEIEYLSLIDTQRIKQKILEYIILLQKQVLKAISVKIEKASSKEELLKVLYELRYFNLIPVDNKKNISQISKLEKDLIKVENEAIIKMYELKMTTEICKTKNNNQKILRNIFSSNIIKLEDIHLKVVIGKDEKNYLIFYDDNSEDKRIEIGIDKTDIKVKRKIKVIL